MKHHTIQLFSLFLLLACGFATATSAKSPNIVFFLVDDLG
jgi:hypothetical protein